MSYTITIPKLRQKYSSNNNRGRFKPNPYKVTENDIINLSEYIHNKFSRYYLTYNDILTELDTSYHAITKLMPQLVREGIYLRRGATNEAHFVLPEHLNLYEEYDLPRWKKERSFDLQQKHTADIRGWLTSVHINKLQLKLDPSAAKTIGKQFYRNNFKSDSSLPLVISFENGADSYTFTSYSKGSLIINVVLFNSIKATSKNLLHLFSLLQKIILSKCKFDPSIQIPFSFIINQIYPLRKSFDQTNPKHKKNYYKVKPFTKLSLTFNEIIPFLSLNT